MKTQSINKSSPYQRAHVNASRGWLEEDQEAIARGPYYYLIDGLSKKFNAYVGRRLDIK